MEQADRTPFYLAGCGCVQCGNPVTMAARQIRKFCSDECAKEYKRRIRAGEIERACEWCGKSIAGFPSRQKFCCAECREDGNKAYRKDRYEATAEERRQEARDYYHANPSRSLDNNRRWIKSNPDAVKRISARRRATPQGRLQNSVRVGVHRGIVSGSKAGRRAFEILGYTVDQLKSHLEDRFLQGMTWDNYGEWHIDHHYPLSSFQYEKPEDDGFKRAWALSNLKPLWKADNLKKGDKVPTP